MMSNVYPVIKINPNDDVVIARINISAGTPLPEEWDHRSLTRYRRA